MKSNSIVFPGKAFFRSVLKPPDLSGACRPRPHEATSLAGKPLSRDPPRVRR